MWQYKNTTAALDIFFLMERCNWGGGWGGWCTAQAAESKGQQSEQPNKDFK